MKKILLSFVIILLSVNICFAYDYQNGNVIIPENDFIQMANELKEKDILEQEVLLLKERIDLLESKDVLSEEQITVMKERITVKDSMITLYKEKDELRKQNEEDYKEIIKEEERKINQQIRRTTRVKTISTVAILTAGTLAYSNSDDSGAQAAAVVGAGLLTYMINNQ